ncbi:protein MPE1 [[Emmonsia] crescens]|uniref:Protein MPE1 n=1 Tax=[Emmonsia] crescens TaxID=73230 RepID=A0A2B7ZF67_9EURO|nr:protein MPE1 [Emmonsia crescens]
MSSSSIFPTYLLPSIPFRRRLWKSNKTTISTPKDPPSSTSSNSPSQSNDDDDDNGAAVINTPGFLQGHKSYLRCARCSADLCLTSQIISKGFTGRHGRAYLVSANPSTDAISIAPTSSLQRTSLPNTVTQQPLPRQLVTGAHTVSDIICRFCGSLLGWKYVAAEEESQKYKVGKFILETKKISVCSSWENNDVGGGGNSDGGELFDYYYSQKSSGGSNDDVEFDSQDEEECEDLFSGMWSPWLAARRRRDRNFERRSFG